MRWIAKYRQQNPSKSNVKDVMKPKQVSPYEEVVTALNANEIVVKLYVRS